MGPIQKNNGVPNIFKRGVHLLQTILNHKIQDVCDAAAVEKVLVGNWVQIPKENGDCSIVGGSVIHSDRDNPSCNDVIIHDLYYLMSYQFSAMPFIHESELDDSLIDVPILINVVTTNAMLSCDVPLDHMSLVNATCWSVFTKSLINSVLFHSYHFTKSARVVVRLGR